MINLKWEDAITKVLEEARTSLNYTEIAERIFEKEYRKDGGATPANTVNKILGSNINTHKEKSPFAKVGRGMFILRKFLDDADHLLTKADIEPEFKRGGKIAEIQISIENNKIINAFGIYWNRNLVHWKSTPDLFGIQQIGASEVNFREQRGIYLLHDNQETIYVGQAIEQPLGQRLKYHTTDRLSGRWDRFSWFGFFPVDDNGQLNSCKKNENISIPSIGDTLEAILIESIEPRQNRKQGNTFSGIEYLQKEAPEIKKTKIEQFIREL